MDFVVSVVSANVVDFIVGMVVVFLEGDDGQQNPLWKWMPQLIFL